MECDRQYRVISAQVASEQSSASANDAHVQAALQHASESVAASLYFAMHFARCNIAIISRIYEKYHEAVACAVREGCSDVSQQLLEQQLLQDDCAALLARLRARGCSTQEPCASSASARQPPSPSRLQLSSTSTTAGRERSDGSAVLQAARSGDLPFVASISGGSAAALTGAVKNAVSTNDTVALTMLLSASTVTGNIRFGPVLPPARCSAAHLPPFSLPSLLPATHPQLPLALRTRSLRLLHPAASQALWLMTWTRARAFLPQWSTVTLRA